MRSVVSLAAFLAVLTLSSNSWAQTTYDSSTRASAFTCSKSAPCPTIDSNFQTLVQKVTDCLESYMSMPADVIDESQSLDINYCFAVRHGHKTSERAVSWIPHCCYSVNDDGRTCRLACEIFPER